MNGRFIRKFNLDGNSSIAAMRCVHLAGGCLQSEEKPEGQLRNTEVTEVEPQRAQRMRPQVALAHVVTLFVSVFLTSLFWAGMVQAQDMSKPVMSVDEEVTAFAYAPDGRIVFSVRHMYKAKKYDLER